MAARSASAQSKICTIIQQWECSILWNTLAIKIEIMLIRQSKNSYIRCTERYGYITNQLTRQDRVYNDSGAIFLKQISRKVTSIEEIVGNLATIYPDVDQKDLQQDFLDFAQDRLAVSYGRLLMAMMIHLSSWRIPTLQLNRWETAQQHQRI